jgi:hypothetical protein
VVRELLGGSQNLPGSSRKNIGNGVSCLNNLHDKMISNLIYFSTAYVSEQFTSVRCPLIPKIIMLNIFYVPCFIFVRGSQDYMLP